MSLLRRLIEFTGERIHVYIVKIHGKQHKIVVGFVKKNGDCDSVKWIDNNSDDEDYISLIGTVFLALTILY